jgi:hypothetical protein
MFWGTAMEASDGFWIDRKVVEQVVDITEALANLNYLICVESQKPALVRWYSEQADDRIRALGKLLHSIYGE